MMGKVKDIYMCYISNVDQFIERCLALLSLLSSKFVYSPPHVAATDNDENDYWETIWSAQLPMVSNIPQ